MNILLKSDFTEYEWTFLLEETKNLDRKVAKDKSHIILLNASPKLLISIGAYLQTKKYTDGVH